MDQLFTELPKTILAGLGIWVVLFGILSAIRAKFSGSSIKMYTTFLDYAFIGMFAIGGVAFLTLLARGLAKMANIDLD
ncbi:hypothetical protein ACFQ40_00025 [Kroppenstedtia eburnea]|uniref:hypothetical protein n=1 Tax=Kroppenstedtia eburnea TaxID=714067 RepID=UPI0036444FD4